MILANGRGRRRPAASRSGAGTSHRANRTCPLVLELGEQAGKITLPSLGNGKSCTVDRPGEDIAARTKDCPHSDSPLLPLTSMTCPRQRDDHGGAVAQPGATGALWSPQAAPTERPADAAAFPRAAMANKHPPTRAGTPERAPRPRATRNPRSVKKIWRHPPTGWSGSRRRRDVGFLR